MEVKFFGDLMNKDDGNKPSKLLIFIVAYNAEKTLESVLDRIPKELSNCYEVEVLVIDDASKDGTFSIGQRINKSGSFHFKLHVLKNPINQGYGGNQKIGYRFALEKKFDFVALVHGDGQYAPERLPELLLPFEKNEADVVLGSRMIKPSHALKGGMPLYKFVGNRILTIIQNWLLRSSFAEFHTGYRIYSVNTLSQIPYHLNSNDFHFDTEILIQCLVAQKNIKEIPIPTFYGNEISHVNGISYAKNVLVASFKARMQEYNLFYDTKFDCYPVETESSHYNIKLGFLSTHSFVIDYISREKIVLDLGCADGKFANELILKGCKITAVDAVPLLDQNSELRFVAHDLETGPPSVLNEHFDFVLLLDVIEHLSKPEHFVQALRENAVSGPDLKVIASTGNVAFILTRLLHLFGLFNYGKKGILDITHKRLFTFGTFKQLFLQSGYEIIETKGIPVPFPEVFGDTFLSRKLLNLNNFFIKLSKSIFSYQIIIVARPLPTLKYLLKNAIEESKIKE